MRKRFTLIWTLFSISIFFSNAQKDPSSIIPPSPETQSLFKFLNYPVNNSTGVPEINIPLYTIRHGDIVVPISLSYHASGRKVSDVTGPVGLGWSLNCGGMVSRTVYGKADGAQNFIPESHKTASEMLSSRDYQAMASIYYKSSHVSTGGGMSLDDYDSEYDIYNFFCGGNSGKFVFDHAQQKAVIFPQQPVKISYSYDVPYQIIDEKGFIYQFDKDQKAYDGQSWTVTGRYLTSITAPNNNTRVNFSYQGFGWTAVNSVENFNYNDDFGTFYDSDFILQLLQKNRTTLETPFIEYSESRIQEIDFEEGTVVFNMETGAYPRISSIQVKDKTGTVLKTIEFNRSLLDRSGAIANYKLDDIIIKDRNYKEVEKYHFDYLPSEFFTIESKDYWGYRNGSDKMNILPYYQVWSYKNGAMIDIGHLNTDRDPTPAYAKMGMLYKITYPTGGSTEFTYEGNRIIKLGAEVDGPGLRVKQIKNMNSEGQSDLKTYTYTTGSIRYYPDMKYNATQKRHFTNFVNPNSDPSTPFSERSYNTRVYYSEAQSDVSYQLNQPVVYSAIREYHGTEESNSGFTSYQYSNPVTGGIGRFSPLDFGGCSQPYGGVLFFADLYPRTDTNSLPWYVGEYNMWNTRQLTQLSHCAYDGQDTQGNNTYKVIKSTSYNYNTVKTGELAGIHLYKFSEFPCDNDYSIVHETYAGKDCHVPVFMAADYTISIGKSEMASVVETTYTENGEVSDTIKYFYNDKNLIRETQSKTSSNNEIITSFLYPFDQGIATAAPYNSMVSKNMLTPVIEKTEKYNGKTIGSTLTTYKTDGNNQVPDKIYSVETESPLSSFTAFNGITKDSLYGTSPEVTFDDYDNIIGNLRQVTGKDGVTTSYLWDETGSYPMAKVENATYAQISAQDGKASTYNSKTLYNSLNSLVPNAFITTYSYKPLVGMTSQTDPNGVTTYYEYDDFGRLRGVLDDDSKVTGFYEYHYAGQSVSATSLSVSPTSQTYGYNGGISSVNVTSDGAWSVSSNQSWLTVSPASGSGNGSMTLTCSSNPGAQRSATVTVTAGSIIKTISITQSAFDFTLEPYDYSNIIAPDYNPLISSSLVSLWYEIDPYENMYHGLGVNGTTSPVTVSVQYYYYSGWLDFDWDSSVNELVFWRVGEPAMTDWALISVSSGGITKYISVKFYKN